MRAQFVGLLLAIPLALSVSGTAHACSCVGGSYPVWPPDGATEVALDAPIVVATSDLAAVETKLTADDGSEIKLVEKGRLEMGRTDCVNHHYLFLTPREPLQPQRKYILLAQGGVFNPLLAGAAPRPVSFVTGNALRDPTPPEVSFHLYATPQPEGPALELFVEAQLTEPVFIAVSGQLSSYAISLPASVSSSTTDPFGLSLGVVDCATPTFIDVAGNTFASPRLCEPSKCSAPRTPVWGPCGGYPASPLSWEDWQKLPDGCSAPTDDDSAKGSDGGCALQPAAPRRALQAPLLLAALALLWRASQRRSQKGGSAPDAPAAR